MRPIQVCLSISKELHDSYPGLDDQIFREAAEMLGRKLLEDGILERHLEPDINRPEFHYILILNRRDLPEPKPMNIPSAGSGAMGTIPPKFKLDVKPEQPVIKKSNALFDKCVENCDPAVMKEVSDNVDKMLGSQPAEKLDAEIDAVLYGGFHSFSRINPDYPGSDAPFVQMESNGPWIPVADWKAGQYHVGQQTLRKLARHFAEWGAEHLKK